MGVCGEFQICRIDPADIQVLSRLLLIGTMARCATWPSFSSISSPRSPDSFGRGGARAVVAESLLLKHQLLILNRSRPRAPNLRPIDRVIASLCAGLMRPTRLLRSAIVLKPSTIMAFHRALVKRKYRLLFTPKAASEARPERARSGADHRHR